MKAYFEVIKISYSALFQYRSAVLASLATQIFWGLIKVMVLAAFYATSTNQPISLEQAIAFIWLSQSLIQLLPWTVDKTIEEMVKTGNVAYELARPLDLYWYWFSRSMSVRIVPTLLRCLPLFCIAVFCFDLPLPQSLTSGISFCLSVLLAVLLSTAMTTAFVISLFWTISGEGIQRMLPHFSLLFSGLVIPLPLFPDMLQPYIHLQPFRGLIDIPSQLYLGIIPANEAWYPLAFQLTWTVILVLFGRLLLRRAMKRFVIQGG